MKTKTAFIAALFLLLQTPLFGKETSAFIPVSHGLWQVSEKGDARKVPFVFSQAHMLAGTESKLSPDNRQIAFLRGPNVWLLQVPSMECVQLTAFPEWNLKANGAQNTYIFGWTKDGRQLLIDTVFADWSGEDGPPKDLLITPLNRCSKVITKKPTKPIDGAGKYLLAISSGTLERTEGHPGLYPDNFANAPAGAPSPDGKTIASAHGVNLLVDGKTIAPDIKPLRFWWISPRALAIVSFKTTKLFELRIVTVPEGKIFGPFLEE